MEGEWDIEIRELTRVAMAEEPLQIVVREQIVSRSFARARLARRCGLGSRGSG